MQSFSEPVATLKPSRALKSRPPPPPSPLLSTATAGCEAQSGEGEGTKRVAEIKLSRASCQEQVVKSKLPVWSFALHGRPYGASRCTGLPYGAKRCTGAMTESAPQRLAVVTVQYSTVVQYISPVQYSRAVQ